MTIVKFALTVVVLFITTLVQASNFTQIHGVVPSNVFSQDRHVFVQLPKSYANNSEQVYPVLYLLDGDTDLPLASGVIDRLHKSDAAPEVIIVAIESTNRVEDLTPTVNHDPRGPVGEGGGGDKFLHFIESELIPYIDSKYRTHSFRILSGHSIGGLFVLHAMQSRPQLFQAYLAFSPVVWWADRTTAKNTKAFIAKQTSFSSYLYMDIGSEDGEMRAVYDELHSFIAQNQPKNFIFHSDIYKQQAHGLTSAAGMFNALQGLFLPISMPPGELTNGVSSIKDYYRRLSLQYGQPISAPEWVINDLAYYLVRQKQLSLATALFEFNTQQYPDSANTYDSLADVYEMNGQIEAALEKVNQALKLATKSDQNYDSYVQHKNRLSSLIKATKK
jgi:predicted alpha/beta superfamily hydrolase